MAQPAVWTRVSVTLSARAGNSERILKNPTPSSEGRSCISEPAHSRSHQQCRITDGGIPPFQEWEEVKGVYGSVESAECSLA